MKGLALISGGIDSPAAAGLMVRAGHHIDFVHFATAPFGSEREFDKAKRNAVRINGIAKTPGRMYVLAHGPALTAFQNACDVHLQCVFCKRMMVRCAGALAKRIGADFLVKGDSLGQVASQTLQNIRAEEAVSPVLVVRPLIGFDKREIERFARELQTFDISISYNGKCLAAPSQPSTGASCARMDEQEARLDMDALVRAAVEGVQEIAL